MPDTRGFKKFVSPVLPLICLHRASLVDRLNDVITGNSEAFHSNLPDHKLVLLYAPAGYGKTVLLADLAQQTTIPCCWYTLAAIHADTYLFLRSLIECVGYQFAQSEPDLLLVLELLAPCASGQPMDNSVCDNVLDRLIQIITTMITTRFALLLRDYQHVNECPQITRIVNRLLRQLPSTCILVIESRVIPELNFVHLLAQREVLSLNSKDLRFTADEVYNLAHLQSVDPVDYGEAEQIATSFDGWIAGILLGTRIGGAQFLLDAQVGKSNLFQYIESTVFNHEEAMYHFLVEASIFQRIIPTICAEVLGCADTAQRLSYLERQGLFVTRREKDQQIFYTCHPILRDIFYKHLQEQSFERFIQLHERASMIFLTAHDYEQAIYHALEGQTYAVAVELILEIRENIYTQGQIEMLKGWLEKLPVTIKTRHPRLLLMQANTALMQNDHTTAFALLDLAYMIVSEQPFVGSNNLFQLELHLARSKALFQAGSYQQARDLCQIVVDNLPDNELSIRAEAYMRFGICLNLLGDISTGITHMQKALQLWGRHTFNRHTADAHSALASAYSLQGDFTLAEHHLSRCILCREYLHDEWGKVTSLIQRGAIKQRQGMLSEAEIDLKQALAIARGPLQFQRGEAYALANLADLFLDQNQYDHCLTFAEDSLVLARHLKDNRLAVYSLYKLAMAYLLRGDASTALLCISEISSPEDHNIIDSYEYNVYTIAYGTVLLYQQRYEEACVFFTEKESAFDALNAHREHIQIKISLAFCRLALAQTEAFVACLEEITQFLSSHEGYKHPALVEIRRHSALLYAVETLPEAQTLRLLLKLENVFPPAVEITQRSVYAVAQPVEEHLTLKITALGEPAVIIQGKPISHWRMARAMELFFFFLHTGRPLRKEQILTALWPNIDEQTDHTLHTTIYYLRKTLGDNKCITTRGGTYALNLSACYGDLVWYDVDEFQQHHNNAQQALVQKKIPDARASLLAMINLYQGDYVPSIYSDWCNTRRDELRTLYLDARRSLGQIALHEKTYDESIIHWQHILALDTSQEEAHYGLMCCYTQQEKRGLAIRQYQQCKEILWQELGIEPGVAVKNLYRHLTGS